LPEGVDCRFAQVTARHLEFHVAGDTVFEANGISTVLFAELVLVGDEKILGDVTANPDVARAQSVASSDLNSIQS
jgi:hypothetical protein